MIILLALAVLAICAAVAGFVMVSLASRREDAALSLSNAPRGSIQAFGRRMVGFHGDAVCRRSVRKPATSGHAAVTDGIPLNGEYTVPPFLPELPARPEELPAALSDLPHLVG
jgi:hypothetical protein